MAYSAVVRADSVTERGERLTTLEVEFPRMILSEFNTHRVLSRNSASSRAIPVRKQLRKVLQDPFVPDEFGRNQSGMNPDTDRPLSEKEIGIATGHWLEARDSAVEHAIKLLIGERALNGLAKMQTGKTLGRTNRVDRFDALCQIVDALPSDLNNEDEVSEVLGLSIDDLLNVHKQYANRLLEPFMWHTVITTATEWSNFLALRTDKNAQREIRLAALAMQSALASSEPELLHNEWHLPLFDKTNPLDLGIYVRSIEEAKLVAIGRCARVSYLTHDGKRAPAKDVELALSLKTNGHMSPFEHVARPMTQQEFEAGRFSGNFQGWVQARKEIPLEDNFAHVLSGRSLHSISGEKGALVHV